MWIYIVTWLTISNFHTFESYKVDDYGVKHLVNSATPTYVSESKDMRKEFLTKEEALKFIDNCPYNSLQGYHKTGFYCIRFKLDSLTIKKED